MKLPALRKKRLTKLNSFEKRCTNKGRRLNLLNYFLLPNNNISSVLSENKNKNEGEFRRTQRYIYSLNNIKEKNNEFNKSKRLFFNLNNNNCLSSFYNKSTNRNISNCSNNVTDQEVDKYNNCEKYIKKTLNSDKIKKEISSYLYSSPEKQIRFINYLSGKLNKLNTNNIKNLNNNKINSDCNTIRKIKVMRRLIKDENENINIKLNNNEKENDKDEDKTNIKEFNLFSFQTIEQKKKIKCKKLKYIRNNTNKYIECWDNNLLKNIIPKSLKLQYDLNVFEYPIPKRGLTSLNLNSTNENVDTLKNKIENNSLKNDRLNNYFKRKHTIYLRRNNKTNKCSNNH